MEGSTQVLDGSDIKGLRDGRRSHNSGGMADEYRQKDERVRCHKCGSREFERPVQSGQNNLRFDCANCNVHGGYRQFESVQGVQFGSWGDDTEDAPTCEARTEYVRDYTHITHNWEVEPFTALSNQTHRLAWEFCGRRRVDSRRVAYVFEPTIRWSDKRGSRREIWVVDSE